MEGGCMKIVAILVLALAAGAEPPSHAGTQPGNVANPSFLRLWQQARNPTVSHILPSAEARKTDKPCSIPLVNVTPKVHSRMPIVPPERFGRTVRMPKVEMPAPPCPEEKD